MGFKRIVALLLLTTAACGRLAIKDNCECGFYTSASGQKMYHWPDGAQIKYAIHRDFPGGLRPAVGAASLAYNELFANTQLRVDGESNAAPNIRNNQPDSVSNDGVNGVYWIEGEWPWAEDQPHSDAMTVVTFAQERIVEADVFFKASAFDSNGGRGDQNPTTFDFEQDSKDAQWTFVIAVHELGHSLGRVHSKSTSSVMFPSVGLNFVGNPLPNYDEEKFSSVYELKSN